MVVIPPERLQAALDVLEPYVSHPGTGAIHDPLYRLLKQAEPEALSELQRTLERSVHPAADRIRLLLGLEAPVPDDLAAVLQEAGLPVGADPLGALRRHLRRQAEVRGISDAHIADLGAQLRGARRLAEGVTAVAALLAIFALLGWLAALGLWEIPWGDSPAAHQEAEDPPEADLPAR